jgi:predicted PurR-regulated permease PerM
MDNAKDFAINAVSSSLVPAVQALSGIVEMVGIPFITFYLLKDSRKLKELFVSFVPPRERVNLLCFFDEVAEVLGGYIKGQVAVCAVSGVSVFFFFLIVQLPYAAVFATISAVGELIPVLGPLAASVFAVMFAMTISSEAAIKVAVFYLVMFKLSNAIVYPNLISRAIRLHPVIIMTGLLLFGGLYGALGMIMAVPAMGVARVVLERLLPQHDETQC